MALATTPTLTNDAGFSDDRRYRYWLTRGWAPGRWVNFICLNPSTADASNDDATVRRLRAFAQSWGYGGFWLTNIYAFRATNPSVLKRELNPVGVANDEWLRHVMRSTDLVVCAWGAHVEAGRERRVRAMLNLFARGVQCFGLTKGGHPKHPLYLPRDVVMCEFPTGAK